MTTARDAYLLVRVAMGYDAFAQAAGEESYQMPASTKHDSPYTILTSDKLVSPSSNYYRSYTKGGKTGSLDDWQNFAGWHTQDGETYVSVVLHSPKTDEDPRPALTETAELMDWAFATFTVTAALDTTQPITELPIVYSSQTDTVMIYPADDMQTLLPRAIPHNSKCRYGERGAADAKPKAQIILDAAKVSAASGGNSEPKQGQRSQSARGFCPRSTMRVPQPDIIEHFGNADAVPQPSERCLSRKAGIVRCCLRVEG